MKTLRFLTIAFSISVCAACTSRSNDQTDAQTSNPDSVEAPGVGAAPDNSRTARDSSEQQIDSTSVKKP